MEEDNEESVPEKAIEISNQEQLHELIFQEDDITWQSMIYELARAGRIDPWDIDVSILTREYISMLRKLKEHNFRMSGKVILAAAILLKLKTENLGVEALLALTNPEQFEEQAQEDDLGIIEDKHFTKANLDLRIPMPRKRKITMFELVSALKQALEVDERRRQRILEKSQANPLEVVKHFDIFSKIEQVYKKLMDFFYKLKKNVVEFEEILPSQEKKDKIWTLVPLLHLAQQGRVELYQEAPFSKIFVELNKDMLGKALKKGKNRGQEWLIQS